MMAYEDSDAQALQAALVGSPFIVRVAGLPGDVLKTFSNDACVSNLERLLVLEKELSSLRSLVADAIACRLPTFSAPQRRYLLSVRRACFNGRSLGRWTSMPGWEEVRKLAPDLADRIINLEQEVSNLQLAFEELYQRESARERANLLALLCDERFLRGVALGSPEFVAQAKTLLNSQGSGGKERKLLLSLLRFATRAAAKLSPLSTLTAIGLGVVSVARERNGFHLAIRECAESSLVRINRLVLARLQESLVLHPVVRSRCAVAWNCTAEQTAPGRYQFLRPAHFQREQQGARYDFKPASQVTVNIEEPLLARLGTVLANGPVLYDALLQRLADNFGGAGETMAMESRDAISSVVEGLIQLGYLHLLPPWSTHAPHLEWQIHSFLADLAEPELTETVELLDSLLELERRFHQTSRPAETIRVMNGKLAELQTAIETALGNSLCDTPVEGSFPFYEDVVLYSNSPLETPEIFSVSSESVAEIFRSTEPLYHFTNLFNHRYDVLHSLATFWTSHWQGRDTLPFLQLFWATKSIWREYLRFERHSRSVRGSTFNPFGLETIDQLRQLRAATSEAVSKLVRESTDGTELPSEDLTKLLEQLPDSYRPLLGCCAYIQPVNFAGNAWVLNRLFEGTGRYLSRFIPAMPEPMRTRFIQHLTMRSTLSAKDADAALLDMPIASGGMTNSHLPQTDKVLILPWERLDLEPDRCVNLADLYVHLDPVTEIFSLVDGKGRKLVPVHLGSMNHLFMPVILRFLSLFGPYETLQVLPRPRPRIEEGIKIFDRLRLGNLFIQRRRWEIPGPFTASTSSSSGAAAFRETQTWRLAHGIPEQVFVAEKMRAISFMDTFKPQFIDFRSPTLTSLFHSIASRENKKLIIEESLPAFEDFPCDPGGVPWAVELQIDSLTFANQLAASDTQLIGNHVRGTLKSPKEKSYER